MKVIKTKIITSKLGKIKNLNQVKQCVATKLHISAHRPNFFGAIFPIFLIPYFHILDLVRILTMLKK